MLNVTNLEIALNGTPLFSNLNLTVQPGEILGILAPSGAGKTTLLRALAGFQQIKTGHIYLNQQLLNTPQIRVAPAKRSIGMVFQDFALFPHLTIAENIAFGLGGYPKKQRQKRVTELLNLTHLQGFEKRFPHELSGGQQQRVALARALAPKPSLLLMDEPFSSLDSDLRCQLVAETRTLLKQEQVSAILVTHDLGDAEAMCDSYGQLTPSGIDYLHPLHAA